MIPRDDPAWIAWRAQQLAIALTRPQRDLLLAPAEDPGPHGIATWLELRMCGLLDSAYELTPLGLAVRDVLGAPADHYAGAGRMVRAA